MTTPDSNQVSDAHGGRDDPERRWYGIAIWKRLRLAQLHREPLCTFCLDKDITTLATVCDHIEQWRKGATRAIRWALFIDPRNHQSLCETCHNQTKQIIERGNKPEVGLDGWPVDDEYEGD